MESTEVTPAVAEQPVKLFGPVEVGVASLLGTPVAGGVLLGINGWKMGQKGAAVVGVVMGALLTFSLLGVIRYVPSMPWVLLPVGGVIMWWVTGTLQGDWMKGRRQGGMVVAVVVGLVAAGLLYLVGRQYVVPASARVQALRLEVTPGQGVAYFPPVTEEGARRVGQALKEIGYFDQSGQGKVALLGLEGGRLVAIFPADPEKAKDPAVVKVLALTAQQFLRDGVGAPFTIRLVGPGPENKVLNEVKVDVRPATAPTGGPAARPLNEGGGATSRPDLP